jgi:hypothetical protein
MNAQHPPELLTAVTTGWEPIPPRITVATDNRMSQGSCQSSPPLNNLELLQALNQMLSGLLTPDQDHPAKQALTEAGDLTGFCSYSQPHRAYCQLPVDPSHSRQVGFADFEKQVHLLALILV